MRTLTLFLCLALAPALAMAAGDEQVKLDPVRIDLSNRESLQNGARIFVNYCLSCHSASYMRYNRMGQDLGLTDELVKENLLFAADKIGETMKAVMPAEDAKAAFNTIPPDLTLVTRARKPEWVYTYMRSFYRDDKSTGGWNNTVFENVAMPHVLYEWQGHQRAVFKTVQEKDGRTRKEFEKFVLEKPGSMTPKQFDQEMRDLTNFLVYMGEPAKLKRYTVGIFVLLFLAVFGAIAYLLKREFWKDVH